MFMFLRILDQRSWAISYKLIKKSNIERIYHFNTTNTNWSLRYVAVVFVAFDLTQRHHSYLNDIIEQESGKESEREKVSLAFVTSTQTL